METFDSVIDQIIRGIVYAGCIAYTILVLWACVKLIVGE